VIPQRPHLAAVALVGASGVRGFKGRNILIGLTVVVALCWSGTGVAIAGEAHRTGLDHWAFKPVAHPDVPRPSDSSHVRNPIDAFILARLAKDNLQPSPESDRRTLIRRVSFDLTGLPPTPDEVDAFVADPDPAAYEKLVDRLLASPRYGERWGRHWLDVVRFAESDGFEMNWARPGAYHYRDWVIRAFNDDEPYDRFVREQIAGDALGADAATGFLVGGAWDRVKSPDPVLTAQQRADELHAIVSTAGSAFLGLTVGCARCHDHKFDPISQLDYYRMTAVFAGVQHGERPLTTPETRKYAAELAELKARLSDVESRLAAYEPMADVTSKSVAADKRRPGARIARNVDRFAPVRAKFVRFTILETSDAQPCIDELEIYSTGHAQRSSNVALASAGAKATASGTLSGFDIHKLEHLNDGRYGNERSWISNEIGKGWVQIELPQATEIDRVVWGRDRNLKYKDRLATKYTIEVAETPEKWKLVARSDDRLPAELDGEPEAIYRVPDGSASQSPGELAALLAERKSIKSELQKPGAQAAMAYCGTFQQPGATHRLARGDPTQPKEPVTPGAIELIGAPLDLPAEAPEQQRRLKLAEWITDAKNPLTARVMVNRVWHYHFGHGLVATPSDFGNMGSTPTHPELLDWLAGEFVANGWKLKPLHRLICLSATYRQSSDARPDAMQRDASGALLWRFPPKRLEAEAIRDSVLAISGKLDLTMGGPGFSVFKPNDNYVRVYEPKEQWTPAEFRRMVYATKIRSQQDPTFGAFDCPDGAQITPKRPTSTTPLQALNLLNGSFMLQQAEFFAGRLKSDAGPDAAREVERAFKLAFARAPTTDEREAAVKLVGEYGLPAFCRAMLNANEFVYVR
jgi:hypothetical protein